MSDSLFRRLLNAMSFANVGTLSEFHRVLDRYAPLPATAMPEPAAARNDNVVPFRREEAKIANAFHNPMLPKARLKP
jgi:hypothetical protein